MIKWPVSFFLSWRIGAAALVIVTSFAHAGGKTPSAEACGNEMLSPLARDLKRLKLNDGLIESTEGSDRRLLDALVHIFSLSDEPLLTRLSQSLIENPQPLPKSEVLQNPFYALHPAAYEPYGAVTLTILREEFSDLFDDYELGLLSALIPDSPRVDRAVYRTEEATPSKQSYIDVQRFAEIFGSDLYRSALHRLFVVLQADPTFLMETGLKIAQQADPASAWLDPASVQRTLERLKRGLVSSSDQFTLVKLSVGFMNRLDQWANQSSNPELRTLLNREVTNDGNFREAYLRSTERYLTEVLKIDRNVMAITIATRAMGQLEPLPTPAKILRQSLLARAETFVNPIVLASRQVYQPKSEPIPVRVTNLPKTEFQTKDFFVPPSPRRKRHKVAAPSPVQVKKAREAESIKNDPEVDLRRFTFFAAAPESLELLRSKRVYEFFYMRENEPKLRQVRFAPEVIDWMKENELPARQILSALNLGEFRGGMSGIMPLTARSRRFKGPVYKVGNRGNFRALMIFTGGTWQVLRISPEHDASRDAEWLTPLP